MIQTHNKIEGYEPLLASSIEMIDHYWPAAMPLVQRCIDNTSVPGEYSCSSVYEQLVGGTAFMFVIKKDNTDGPSVKLVIILELCKYESFGAMNIKVLGGEDLWLLHDKFWKPLCGWAYMNGARAFEGFVSPAMERIVSRMGFERTKSCIHVRMPLTGE